MSLLLSLSVVKLLSRAVSTVMTSFSEIMVSGQHFAHWIMGTPEFKFSTVATYTLNKSALIRSD